MVLCGQVVAEWIGVLKQQHIVQGTVHHHRIHRAWDRFSAITATVYLGMHIDLSHHLHLRRLPPHQYLALDSM